MGRVWLAVEVRAGQATLGNCTLGSTLLPGSPVSSFPPHTHILSSRYPQIGLEKAFDALTERDQLALVDLLSALAARGVLGGDDLKEGTSALLEGLEDIALDIPAAPRLLGRLLGAAAAGGLLGLDWAAKAVSNVESAEPRRGYVAAALKAVQEAGGDERLQQEVADAKLDLPALLAHDDEFDGPMPTPAEFLQQQGLGVLA